MRSDLPTGTVTFLFTDIEGSTKLLHELGDAYAETLAEHRRVLRDAFTTHGGVEVDTQGDAFFYGFARARDAIAAAEEAQRALAGGSVRVRMGVHTGEPIATDEGYVGMDVHRAARVMSAGHGGQVVLSQTTRDLLDEGADIRDLGEHRLKDLSAPQRLFQLGSGDFPRLKTLHQTNLPVQPTPLVGRRAELGEVLALLHEARLVTLTGAGGSGKTRLALHAAAELVDEFPEGVWWVPLAAVRDPALVESTIGQVVGSANGLADHLRGWRTLLLVDNFEHVVAAAPAVAALLSEAPEVRVLATSREHLAVAAEQEYSVPTLAPSEAVELFTARARQFEPGFEPNDAVAEICRRLDGLPLALELAAARIKVLSPERILERLGRSLDLLTAGSRDAPERQRTLRATIEWSYELLDERERELFGRLAVFTGSFDLEAAEAVADADIDTLAALVDKSLLRHTVDDRFFVLETIREYARERLERLESEVLEARHAAYYLDRVLERKDSEGVDEDAWYRDLDLDYANVRIALSTLGRSDPGLQLEAAAALRPFWEVRGYVTEGRRWLDEALARGVGRPETIRTALNGAANLARVQGDYGAAAALATRHHALAEEAGDAFDRARALTNLATIAADELDYERGAPLQADALALLRPQRAERAVAVCLDNLAYMEIGRGKAEAALPLLDEALEINRRIESARSVARTLLNRGAALLALGRPDDARSAFLDALRTAAELNHIRYVGHALQGIAAVVAASRPEEAACLLGAGDRLLEEIGVELDPVERELREAAVQAVIDQLGARADAALAAGAALSRDEAIGRAVALDRAP